MSVLWQVGYATAVILGIVYILVPKQIHEFGFEFLRRSPPVQSEDSSIPVWSYRGLGVVFLFIGIAGSL